MAACVAAVVLSKPRVTVSVVPRAEVKAVTAICSPSIWIVKYDPEESADSDVAAKTSFGTVMEVAVVVVIAALSVVIEPPLAAAGLPDCSGIVSVVPPLLARASRAAD